MLLERPIGPHASCVSGDLERVARPDLLIDARDVGGKEREHRRRVLLREGAQHGAIGQELLARGGARHRSGAFAEDFDDGARTW